MIKEMNSLAKSNSKKSATLTKLTLFVISMMIVLGNSATFSLQSVYKGMPIKIVEVLMGINLVLILIDLLLSKNKYKDNFKIKTINYRYIKILLLWTFFGISSALVNSFFNNYTGKELAYGTLYSLRLLFYIVYTFCAIKYLLFKGVTLISLMKNLVISYVIVALFGFIQLIIWPSAIDFYAVLKRFGIYLLNPDPHVNRLISTYLDPNFLGSILLMPIGICFAFVFENKKNSKWIIMLIILITADFLTVSRSAVLGIVLFIIIFLVLSSIRTYKSKNIGINIKIFFSTLTILLSIPVIYNFIKDSRLLERIIGVASDPSALARVSSWEKGVQLFKDNPIIGVGYNMIGFYTDSTQSITSFGLDSTLLLICVTTGIIGLTIFLIFILDIIVKLFKGRKNNFYLSNAMIAIIIGSIAMSFFNNLLLLPLWIAPFLLIINMIFQSNNKNQQQGRYD